MATKKEKMETQEQKGTFEIEGGTVGNGTVIIAKGPSDPKNGATILRYTFDDRRKTPLDIQEGTTLQVGEDIDLEDAKRLLELDSWDFERVDE